LQEQGDHERGRDRAVDRGRQRQEERAGIERDHQKEQRRGSYQGFPQPLEPADLYVAPLEPAEQQAPRERQHQIDSDADRETQGPCDALLAADLDRFLAEVDHVLHGPFLSAHPACRYTTRCRSPNPPAQRVL
jgi:hypothetical protein